MRSWAYWFGLLAAMARAKELDPAACPSRFNVEKDKIIRTEESREMGARYLSELDVGSRQECLRLCCETDACDVFVYEEKSPGSCYLFNCGPPENFRCKFTAHGNFSSGVLALSRGLAELQDQERLALHEQELASLRSVSSTTLSPTTTTRPAPHPPPPPPPPSRRCNRYQFECHSGGECIAVYNACDGIPQCADGSDEAPELHCPSAAQPAVVRPPSTTTAAAPTKPIQENIESSGSDNVVAEGVALGNDRWPHRLVQAQPQHRFTENAPSSHIFSHKGGLLQEPDSNVLAGNMMNQYPAFEPPWQRRPWNQPAPSMEMSSNGWPGGVAGGGGYGRYEWPEPDPRRVWPVPQPEMPLYMPPKTMPETADIYSNQQQTLRDSPKKGFELAAKPPVEAVTEPAAPPVAAVQNKQEKAKTKEPVENTTKKKELKHEVGGGAAAGARAAGAAGVGAAGGVAHAHFAAPDAHDGLSEHPPAAVMLLVLGILMTAILGVMIACRARAARRRLRRGKSPFAHDADYLVNGMYL